VRTQSQPFGLITWGQEVEFFVKEVFVVGTTSGRIFTSVRFQVCAWDTDIQGTNGVINTTREVLTESVILQTDITGTWVFVVTIFVFLTFIFAFAFSLSVFSLSTISPLCFTTFTVQVSFTLVIATFLLSSINAANGSEFSLWAVTGEVALISTIRSICSFYSLTRKGSFVADCFEASLGELFRGFNGCTIDIFLAFLDADVFVWFEGVDASFNFVTGCSVARLALCTTNNGFIDTFKLVRVFSLSDAFCSFTSISWFANQIALSLNWFTRWIWVIDDLARGGSFVANSFLAFQRTFVFLSVFFTVTVSFAKFGTFFRFGISEYASLDFVANIGGTWVFVVTSDCFSNTAAFLGSRISNALCGFTCIRCNTSLLAFVQAWVAIRVVDQYSSASLGFRIADCILAFVCKAVLGSP